MSSLARVTFHPSQFPDRVRSDLLQSLRTRQVNHKFHYDSIRQTQKWLALHQQYSPARTDPDCAATYDRSFEAATQRIHASRIHLFGLGCGGGQKDSRLLQLLAGKEPSYTPCDVSAAMVLHARNTALKVMPQEKCLPFVCDLATADDLSDALDELAPAGAARVFTFFGMIPNFEPELILPQLAKLIRPADYLLFSANLSPGPDYLAGIQRILPLYDNAATRDWLMTFLIDVGIEETDGEMIFGIEKDAGGELARVSAQFRFVRDRTIMVEEETFRFSSGETFRLFFSYRHTPALVHDLLKRHALQVLDQWITQSEEEGVFLVGRFIPDKPPSYPAPL